MAEIGLAIVRNSLGRGVYREQERSTLASIREDVVHHADSPFRQLILEFLERGMALAEAGDYERSHQEINFIHDLPLYQRDLESWYEDWFFQGRVPGYLARCEDPEPVRRTIVLLAEVIAGLRKQPTRDDYRNFLTDLGPRLVDEALDAKRASEAAAGGPDEDFHTGTLLGWHNAISAVRSTAATFEVPLADLRLADFDPLELLD